ELPSRPPSGTHPSANQGGSKAKPSTRVLGKLVWILAPIALLFAASMILIPGGASPQPAGMTVDGQRLLHEDVDHVYQVQIPSQYDSFEPVVRGFSAPWGDAQIEGYDFSVGEARLGYRYVALTESAYEMINQDLLITLRRVVSTFASSIGVNMADFYVTDHERFGGAEGTLSGPGIAGGFSLRLLSGGAVIQWYDGPEGDSEAQATGLVFINSFNRAEDLD
ncbi:MAG: hypothetical protein KC561_20605, partial [Myxococcales bacterium]|nr:hypothetical protein [Myxococcales bacterium]